MDIYSHISKILNIATTKKVGTIYKIRIQLTQKKTSVMEEEKAFMAILMYLKRKY